MTSLKKLLSDLSKVLQSTLYSILFFYCKCYSNQRYCSSHYLV